MPIVILVCGLLIALAGLGLGALADLTVWGCLGVACVAGNLAVMALVLTAFWRAAAEDRRELLHDTDAAAFGKELRAGAHRRNIVRLGSKDSSAESGPRRAEA